MESHENARVLIVGTLPHGCGFLEGALTDEHPDAALRLCGAFPGAPPGEVTGRIAYSMDLLGRPFPDDPWALPATFLPS